MTFHFPIIDFWNKGSATSTPLPPLAPARDEKQLLEDLDKSVEKNDKTAIEICLKELVDFSKMDTEQTFDQKKGRRLQINWLYAKLM